MRSINEPEDLSGLIDELKELKKEAEKWERCGDTIVALNYLAGFNSRYLGTYLPKLEPHRPFNNEIDELMDYFEAMRKRWFGSIA